MDETAPESIGRRGFLMGAGAATTAAVATPVVAEEDEANGTETEVIEIGDNWFDPDDLTIEVGTMVRWEWVGQIDHNVNPTSQPDGADWEGHLDLKSEGDYEFTFEVEGVYEYTCDPHPGMDGRIEVVDELEEVDEVLAGPIVPDEAMTLAVGTAFALAATLGFAYVFLKYGGAVSGREE